MTSRFLTVCFLVLIAFSASYSFTPASTYPISTGDSIKTASSQVRISITDLEEVLEYEIAGEETVSGINIYPHERKNTFMLAFTQSMLKEKAMLTVSAENGDVVFSQVVEPGKGLKPKSIGNLDEGIYLIEVKTSDTTFWKKIRIVK
jgi:hypothetical protein